MKVERTKLGPTRVKLIISGSVDDLEPIRRHVLAHFRHNVSVPGFRAGLAPLSLVEKNIDQKRLLDEFLEHALNQLYGKTVQQEDLRPVGQPQVQLKKFVPFTDLQLEVETDVIGSITLPDYKKIKLTKTKPQNIATSEVSQVLKSLQQRTASRKEVRRAAKKGDEVIIDFDGSDSRGKPVSGADGKDYPLVLGSGSFIPGFEERLVGLKTGGEKKFNLKFPKDYAVAALQSKSVNFNVVIKKINELSMPKLDDAFASKVGPFKSFAELKSDIKKQLQHERQQQADKDFENKLIAQIVHESKLDLPDSLIEEEITRLEDEEKRNLTYRGQTWQEHLKEEGIDEQQHHARQRPKAEQRLKGALVLSQIAKEEKLQISDEDIDRQLTLIKAQYSFFVRYHELL